MTDHGTDIDVTHVRQARRGRHAFIILVSSLALGVIVMATVLSTYWGGFHRLHVDRKAEAATAHSVTTPSPTTGKGAPDAG